MGPPGAQHDKGALSGGERGLQLSPSISPSLLPQRGKDLRPQAAGGQVQPSLHPSLCCLRQKDGGPGCTEPVGRGLLWRPRLEPAASRGLSGFRVALHTGAWSLCPRGLGLPWGRPSEEGAEAAVWWVWPLGTLQNSSCPCRLEPADRSAPAPWAKPSMIDYGGHSHQAEWARRSQAAARRGRGGLPHPHAAPPSHPCLPCTAALPSGPSAPSLRPLWGLRACPREEPLPQVDQAGPPGLW